MSNIELFRYDKQGAVELAGKSALIEKHLQSLIESQMEVFLGARFLASEYETGKVHKGRIDSLALDENNCPVIVEYKRQVNENVITQGLFYLDWLLDHRAEFQLLVMKKLGQDTADKIEWTGTRLLCIASDFTRYDEHAVAQINKNISLIRYKLFAPDLLLLELVNSTVASVSKASAEPAVLVETKQPAAGKADKTFVEQLVAAPPELLALYEDLKAYITTLGDDVTEKQLKLYVAFRRLKNFVCAYVATVKDPHVRLWLKLDPTKVVLEEGFSRDVRQIGHWGTGDLELQVRDAATLAKAKLLIEQAYQEN